MTSGLLLHLPRAVLIYQTLVLPFDLVSFSRAVQLHPSLIDRHRSPDIPLDQVRPRGLCKVFHSLPFWSRHTVLTPHHTTSHCSVTRGPCCHISMAFHWDDGGIPLIM